MESVYSRTKNKKCSLAYCDRRHKGQGYCDAHLKRAKAGKELEAPIRTRREKSEPYEGGWRLNAHGYLTRTVRSSGTTALQNRTEFQHRTVVEAQIGRNLLPEETVHHKNGVRTDNRIENLELWSSRQPAGQRVEDKVQYALEILELYAPERIR